MARANNNNSEAWRDKVADKLDELLAKTSTIEGKLEGLPNRVHLMETAVTRIDTTLATLVGSVTRHELRTDKNEERLRGVEDEITTLKGERRGVNWVLEFLKIGGAGGIGAALVKLLGGPA